MTSPNPRHPASFRDPAAFVFRQDGRYFRQVNQAGSADYTKLMDSGLYGKLVDAGLLLPHEEAPMKAPEADAFKVLSYPTLPFVSYPWEWSFSQLQEAALATLAVQKFALGHGMILKDASAFNIQWYNGRMVLIDTSSLTVLEDGQAWQGYQQYCMHFLAPLALMHHRDLRLSGMFRQHLDGIPLDLAAELLPPRAKFSLGLGMHLFLHAKSITKYQDSTLTTASVKNVSTTSLLAMADNLEQTVKRLKPKRQITEWAEYYSATNYSTEAAAYKEDAVRKFIAQVKPSSVWDIGANTGRYSAIAAKTAAFTLACDIDPVAVDLHARELRQKQNRTILPLVMDLTNPTPSLGFAEQERDSLSARGPADMVMALALVHHLALSNNLPLERIAEYFAKLGKHLILEFVPKEDSQVQKLLATRKDIFPHYTVEGFEAAFSGRFSVLEKINIKGSSRLCYLMQKLP